MNELVNMSFLRPLKQIEMAKLHDDGLEERDDLRAYCFPKSTILPQRSDSTRIHGLGGVVSSDGTFAEVSGLGDQFGGAYPFDHAAESDKKVCFCGYLIKHWGHFLLDVVSRLWYAMEKDDEIEAYVFIVQENTTPELSGNYAEFFRLFGISDKIQLINTPTRFKEVVVPERAFFKRHYYSKKFTAIFDRVAERVSASQDDNLPERVYLSRNHFRGKDIESGLDFVDHFFSKNEYKILYPEEISLAEMIRLIRGAKICASESGTLTHNFLFAQEEKEVVIIERQVTINDYQCDIDIAKRLRSVYVDANYEIYTTAASYGPYLLGYTNCFRHFTEAYGYLEPDPYYSSDKYLKKCLRKYMMACDIEYGYKRQYASWQMIARRAIMRHWNASSRG